MTERDPLPALRGLIDEPIAPRAAFADELRARLLTELGSHRPPAISEERTMEITTPGLQLAVPRAKSGKMPSWRRIAEIAAIAVLLFGLLTVFASERAGSPSNPKPTMEAMTGANTLAASSPEGATASPEAESSVLWQSAWNGTEGGIPTAFALANGAIYRFQSDGNTLGVEALDAITGGRLWWSPAAGDGIAADANGVYITATWTSPDEAETEDGPKTIIALDPVTGDELWNLASGIGESEPIVDDGVLYVRQAKTDITDSAAFTEIIKAIDTSTGEELWITTIAAPSVELTPDLPLPQHSIVIGDDMVAIVARRGEIIGLRRSDGARIWAQTGFPANATDLGISGDTLIASSYFYTNGPPEGFPEITTQSAVVAMKISDGTPLWSQDLGDLPTNVAVAQGYAIVTIDANLLPKPDYEIATPVGAISESDWATVGFNIETGEREVNGGGGGGDGRGPDPIAIADGQFVLLVDNNLSASFRVMEPTSGNSQPSHLLLGQPIVGSPLSDGEHLYLQLQDGTIVAVNQAMPSPPATAAEIAELMPETGGPLPESVVWHVDQPVPWQPEWMGLPLGGMVVADGTVFRALVSFQDPDGNDVFQGLEAFDAQTGSSLWQIPLKWLDGGSFGGDAIVAGDGAVYVVVDTSTNENGPSTSWDLVAFDGATGEQRWRKSFSRDTTAPYDAEHDESIEAMSYANGVLYTANGSAVITAYNSQSGDQHWRASTPSGRTNLSQAAQVQEGSITEIPNTSGEGSQTSITEIDGRLYIVTSSGQVAVLDPENGDYLGAAIPESSENTTKPVVVGNLLIVGNTEHDLADNGFTSVGKRGLLTAFDITDNYSIAWQVEVGRSAESVVALNNGLYVTVGFPDDPSKTVVERINPEDGGLIWTSEGLGQSVFLRSSSDPLGSLVAQSIFDGVLYTLEPVTGDVIATSKNFPVIALEAGDNGYYYATLLDGALVAVTPLTTQSSRIETVIVPTEVAATPAPAATSEGAASTPEGLLWTSAPESGEFEGSSVVFAGNVVIRAIKTSDFYGIAGLNSLSGEQLWSQEMVWTGAPVSDGRVVYVPADSAESGTGALIAIDPLSGDIRWETTFGGQVSTPNLQLGGIYVLSSNDMVTMLDPISGDKEWESVMDSSPYAVAQFPDLRAPAVAVNAVVAISNSGTMFAFDRYTGDQLWSKQGYGAASARYAAAGDVLVVVDTAGTMATPEATVDPELPMRIERIDLQTGETLWTLPALLTLPDQPVVSYSTNGIGSVIYVIAEQVQTAGGLYDEDGFHPDATLTAKPSGSSDEGTLLTIQASSGDVASLQFFQQFSYGTLGVNESGGLITWPLRTPTNNGPEIDLGQPIYGPPATDNQIFLLTLQDGTLVALDASAVRLG